MAADAIIFVFLGIVPRSKSWSVLEGNKSKRVFWHTHVPCGVQKDKYFSFHPTKSAQNSNFLAFSLHFQAEFIEK